MLEREMDINYSADNARQDRFAQVKENGCRLLNRLMLNQRWEQ